MHFLEIITLYIDQHIVLTYCTILFAIVIEGEVALIVLGILAHTRLVPLPAAITLAVFGAAIKTTAGYVIGQTIKKYIPKNKMFDFMERRVLAVFPHFAEKPFWSLFFSKFIYGLNHFTIIFAGYIGSRVRTYITAEAISSVAWITIMFSIGYFFSYAAFELSHDIRKVALYLLVGIFAFLLVEKIVGFIIELVES